MVHHNFIVPEFKELWDLISTHALNLFQLKRAIFIGIDSVTCGCVVRHTYNLSCAHEITLYKRDNQPILLETIYSYWRKLDIVDTQIVDNTQIVDMISYHKDMEIFIHSFLNVDNKVRVHMLKKLREIKFD